MQVINAYFKGQLTKVEGHAGTKHGLVREDSATAFQFPAEVNSFHDYAVSRKKLGKELIPLAHDAEDTIEKMRMIKRLGLDTMTRIPDEQVKAMVIELAPELKDSIQ